MAHMHVYSSSYNQISLISKQKVQILAMYQSTTLGLLVVHRNI
jgi:hypothetical protein